MELVANPRHYKILWDALKGTMDSQERHFETLQEKYIYELSFNMGKITGSFIGRVILLEEALLTKTEELHRDHTTQLLNGAAIERQGSEWVKQQKPFVAVFFDLLNFKKINDIHGHTHGNQYLQDIGDILVKVTKNVDLVARIGGDEFLILLDTQEATEEPSHIAYSVIDRTKRYVNGYNSINYPELHHLGISGGYAIYDPEMHPTLSSVISEADISMSLNKKQQHTENGGAYRV